MDLDSFVERIQNDVQERFQTSDRVLSYSGFLEVFLEHPYRHLRTAPQYLLQMFDFFGTREGSRVGQEVRRFRLFDAEVQGENALVGEERAQDEVYRNILSFAKRGAADKMLLIHGPNGSGKTTLIECIMRGLEIYSRTPEGTLLTFNWVFTDREGKFDRIGFEMDRTDVASLGSYAYLDDRDISARIPCELHDHPILLVPQEQRGELIREAAGRTPRPAYADFSEEAVASVLLSGDLCQKCKKIYDALLVAYHGDWRKVLRHVQVERFYISKRYQTGAVSIEPQGNIDAAARPIHAEGSWNIPTALRNLSLYQPVGDIVDANRGMLEYSDFLKRPLEANKYLLTTCERGTVNLANSVAYLDVTIFGTANEKQLSLFKRNPDFSSFKGRIELIPVPYLLRFSTEVELYRRHVRSFSRGRHVSPHAAKVGALWAVLTRLRKADPSHFEEPLGDIAQKLTPMEKAKLYDSGEVPEHFSEEERKALRARVLEIRQEYEEDEREFEGIFGAEYEGRRGASPREMMTVFARAAAAKTYSCLTPMAVFEALEELVKDASLYDFLRLPEEDGYHDVRKLLRDVRCEYLNWVTNEVYDSIDLIDESEYDRIFLEYFRHVKAFDSKEQIYNSSTNTYESPREEFMAQIESLVTFSESAKEFRSEIMTRIAAWSLDHRQQKIDYHALFPQIYRALRDNFYRDRNRILTLIERDILKFGTDEFDLLSPADQAKVKNALGTMKSKYRYCDDCARDVLAYVLKSRQELEGPVD